MVNTIMNELNHEHRGAVAFEYVIIVVIMAVCIFTAWGTLADQIIIKANEIANFIADNGRSGLTNQHTHRGNQQWTSNP